jgi:hypothetical protein
VEDNDYDEDFLFYQQIMDKMNIAAEKEKITIYEDLKKTQSKIA